MALFSREDGVSEAKRCGHLLRDEIEAFWRELGQRGCSEDEALAVGERHAEVLQAHLPGYLPYLEGLAAGTGEGRARFLAYRALREQVLPEAGAGGCTAWAATGMATYDGFTLVGGNSDNDWPMRASLVVRQPKEGYRYLAAEIPIKGLVRAMNEQGFCFARNEIFPDPEWRDQQGAPAGLANDELTVKLAATCESVDEAIAALAATPRQPSVWKSFTLADAAGRVALVQVTPAELEVIAPDGAGWTAVTNHYLAPGLTGYDTRARQEGTSTWYRYRRAVELKGSLRGKKADPYTLMRFCRDTENLDLSEPHLRRSICVHDKNYGTVFSFVMQPALKIMWYCYGPPDGLVAFHEPTWGRFAPFALPELLGGQYVTEDGVVSPEYPYPYAREHLRLRPLKVFGE